MLPGEGEAFLEEAVVQTVPGVGLAHRDIS